MTKLFDDGCVFGSRQGAMSGAVAGKHEVIEED